MGVALGLDGCAGGWLAVCLDRRGRFRAAGMFPRAAGAIQAYRPAAVAVDIPIGLTADGARTADAAARQALAGAASSVFNAPPRAVVEGRRDRTVDAYEAANQLSRRLAGKGLSRQSWSLVDKIEEIDALAGAGAGIELIEVHPEVSFRLLAGGRPLARKQSWTGLMARRRLLGEVGVELPDEVDGDHRAQADDVLDAAVAAWTAAGLAAGAPLVTYPAEPAECDRGRPIAIWARPRPSSR